MFKKPGRAFSPYLFLTFLFLAALILFLSLARQRHVPPEKVQPRPPPLPQEIPKAAGLIAIIVDDSGYNGADCQYLSAIRFPVTVSVLPQLPHSRTIAECAYRQEKEVMLHLPLEPHVYEERYPADYVIKTDMAPQTVRDKIEKALASVPHAAGINNHMGSKATEDPRLMSLVLSDLRKRHLFFVDSRVTSRSVCGPLARRFGVPFAERDVFLDNENRRPYIEQQFNEVAREARQKGYAVAIGHARPLTLTIIREQTQRLTEEGFRIVPVTEIMERSSP